MKRDWRPAQTIPFEEPFLSGAFGYDEEDDIRRDEAVVKGCSVVFMEGLATPWNQVRYLDPSRSRET